MRPMWKSSSEDGTSVMYVLPSTTLRELVYKHRHALVPGCSYTNMWRDTNGYGIMLACPPQTTKGDA